MGGVSNQPIAQQATQVGQNVTTGLATQTIQNLQKTYGLYNSANYNLLGGSMPVTGAPLAQRYEQYAVNKVNMPMQVGIRGFDSGAAYQQLLSSSLSNNAVYAGAVGATTDNAKTVALKNITGS